MRLGNIVFRFVSDTELLLNQELLPFLEKERQFPDVMVSISWNWNNVQLPKSEMEGRDALQEYYNENGRYYVLSIGNGAEYLACAVCESDFRVIDCRVNGNLCYPSGITLGTVMRFLPLKTVFTYFGVLFFHASQIAFQGKGILFTAPSGTGKTTQAGLWKNYRYAHIVCNDRTLIRKRNKTWEAYGYPLDGTNPVRSSDVYPLGCIVLLKQGSGNQIERLYGTKAVTMLMPQLVLDGWDADARVKVIETLFELLTDIPVYLYICTKKLDAVEILENKLRLDGVLNNGNDSGSPLE